MKDLIIINYIANAVLIVFVLFCIWLLTCYIIYRDKSIDVTDDSQSDRQKRNDDYNNDYYP